MLSQPIYRDALLLGKFLGGLATLAVALMALFLIVFGAGLLLLGLPPRGPEVARGVAFLLVAIAYGGVWLAVAMLFSVIFRSTATSALCALGLWLFFFILWPMIASAITTGFTPAQFRIGRRGAVARSSSRRPCSGSRPARCSARRCSACCNPETKAFGDFANLVMAQTRGMIPGTPLPFDQSLLLIWPQITGLIAGMIVVFADRLHRLPARGSQGLKDWTVTAALNNARWCNAVCFAHGTAGTVLGPYLGQCRAGAALLSQRR